MRFSGIVTRWNDARGFGFITPSAGEDELFVHIKAFRRSKRPEVGQAVTFEVGVDSRGRKRAIAVEPVKAARTIRSHGAPASNPADFAWITGFAVIYAVVDWRWRVPGWMATWYVIASIVGLVSYGLDKSAAKGGGRRTPESQLLAVGLLCGWPGALLAQRLFRHKVSKESFMTIFRVTIVLNIACFIVLASPFAQHIFGR